MKRKDPQDEAYDRIRNNLLRTFLVEVWSSAPDVASAKIPSQPDWRYVRGNTPTEGHVFFGDGKEPFKIELRMVNEMLDRLRDVVRQQQAEHTIWEGQVQEAVFKLARKSGLSELKL